MILFFFRYSFFYLVAERPQAPCLSVRMLTIFWMSCVAVTWSRYFAARIRWSHILSSSRFSAAYWAQLDWKGNRSKSMTNSALMEASHVPRESTFNVWFIKCAGILKFRLTKADLSTGSIETWAVFSHIETILSGTKWKAQGHFCPCGMLINNSGHIFTKALRHTESHDTHSAEGGHFSLSEFVIRMGLWTLQWCWKYTNTCKK